MRVISRLTVKPRRLFTWPWRAALWPACHTKIGHRQALGRLEGLGLGERTVHLHEEGQSVLAVLDHRQLLLDRRVRVPGLAPGPRPTSVHGEGATDRGSRSGKPRGGAGGATAGRASKGVEPDSMVLRAYSPSAASSARTASTVAQGTASRMSAQPASRRWCVTSATVPVAASTHGSAMAIVALERLRRRTLAPDPAPIDIIHIVDATRRAGGAGPPDIN